MLYTKELVSGRDINTKSKLGIIHQPIIDDFMGDFDLADFIKPFYIERLWKVNGVFDKNNNPFSIFYFYSMNEKTLIDSFSKSLELLYPNKTFKLFNKGSEFHITIYNEDKKAVAIIDDEDFDLLCRIVTAMVYYEDPKPTPKEEKKDKSLEAFEKLEAKFKKKHKKKNKGLCFEERVRELIHMKNCFYEDIGKLTVWQFEDAYRTLSCINSENRTYQFASSGNFDNSKLLKDVKKWQELTIIEREDAE